MLMKGSHSKMIEFSPNLPGATSFWVSTSIWESLLNAKMSIFNHVAYERVMGMMKKVFSDDFQVFFIVHVLAGQNTQHTSPQIIFE